MADKLWLVEATLPGRFLAIQLAVFTATNGTEDDARASAQTPLSTLREYVPAADLVITAVTPYERTP